MKEQPLSVAVAALIHNNKILLIKRSPDKKDYPGFRGLILKPSQFSGENFQIDFGARGATRCLCIVSAEQAERC